MSKVKNKMSNYKTMLKLLQKSGMRFNILLRSQEENKRKLKTNSNAFYAFFQCKIYVFCLMLLNFTMCVLIYFSKKQNRAQIKCS